MGDLDGVADAIRKLSRKIDGVGRVRIPWWAWVLFAGSHFGLGAGCVAYIHSVNAPLWAIILKQQKDIDALREIQSLQMADPKWFNKIEAQNQAIREWKKNHVNAND